MRFVLWATLAIAAGCTALAGLDGDYVIGPAASSAESSSVGAAAASSASSGGANEAASGTGAATTSAGGTGGTGGSSPLSCDDQYVDVPSYYLCAEDLKSCSFNADTSAVTSCDAICIAFGGECLQAFDNDNNCTTGDEVPCSHVEFQNTLCICSKGCGSGPPCTVGLECVSGACI